MQQRLRSIGGHEHNALRDGVAGVSEAAWAPLDPNLPALGASDARKAVEQFLLTLTFKRRDPENLAAPHFQRNVAQGGAKLQSSSLQGGWLVARMKVGACNGRRCGGARNVS